LVTGGNNSQLFSQEGQGEAALDVQEAAGIAAPAKGYFYSTNGIPPINPDSLTTEALNSAGMGNEPYLNWVTYTLAQQENPYVISTSYGDDEQSVPFSYASRVCSDFGKLSVRGSTLFFASGDFGVGGVQPTNCTLNNGSGETAFLPVFPASCPVVTTVGGVSGFSPEVVTVFPDDGGSSGGGFSNYFSRPSYQDTAVEGYFAKIGDLYEGVYNRQGRAYPDIAFNARNLSIIFNAKNVRISGTSAAAPGAAGLFTLLNDARIAAGKSVLGCINPLLYSGKLQAAGGFKDTTQGSNYAYSPGCNYTSGFPALEGWDAATGFGSPIFEALKTAVLELP